MVCSVALTFRSKLTEYFYTLDYLCTHLKLHVALLVQWSWQFDDYELLEMPVQCLILLLFVFKIYVWKTVVQHLKAVSNWFVIETKI